MSKAALETMNSRIEHSVNARYMTDEHCLMLALAKAIKAFALTNNYPLWENLQEQMKEEMKNANS